MEPFEVHGLWWLPEHEEHRVPGVLSWDPTRGGTLRLVGQLRPIVILERALPSGRVQRLRDRKHKSERSYPVVHGQAERVAYTLLNSFQTTLRDWSFEQSSETIHVNAVLEGAFFESPALRVDRARFRMRDLAAWVDLSGLEVRHPRMDRTGEEFAVVSATHLPDVVIRSDGPNVSLGHQLGDSRVGAYSAGIEQDWVLRVDQTQVAPLQTFVDIASDVQDLVTIATGRTAELQSAVLYHPELPLRSLAGTPIGRSREALKYHAQWTNRVDHDSADQKSREPLQAIQMHFTLEHIGPEGLGRWLDVAARFRTELGRAMATRYSRAYLEDRIMNVCAALESFDKHYRQTTNDVWYIDRIAACIDLAGDTFRELILEDPNEWSRRVRDLRNDLAHHTDQFRLDGTVGGHLISEQVFWLFVLCMLRVAQAPDAVFDTLAKHPQWRWLQEQARETTS